MVIAQDPAQPLAASDPALQLSDLNARLKDPVAHCLVIALTVIESEEFANGVPQRWLAKEDHPMQAFVLDRPHEPFDVRRQIRRSGR